MDTPTFFAQAGMYPFFILGICVAFIIFAIAKLRFHPFLALVLAAILAGLLTPFFPGEPSVNHWVQAVELSAVELGIATGKIAIVIVLAAIIGMCMMESGAADKVVRRFLAVFGEKRAGLALLISTYVVSMPIFFDTLFMLLVPLAKALRLRTGKDYMLYVLVICGAGVITHSTVAPHPGPLAMASDLKVDLGLSILVSVIVGIVPAAWVWFLAQWMNKKYPVPLREGPKEIAAFENIMAKSEKELPSFIGSITPIILPILLITFASLFDMFSKGYPGIVEAVGSTRFASIHTWVQFIGNKNVALLIGTALAIRLLVKHRKMTFAGLEKALDEPLKLAGIIILITAAGGAFGSMLRNAGVGEAVKILSDKYALNAVILGWLMSAVLKLAQGSGTVAMLVTSAMMATILGGDFSTLGYHPVYIFLAIGFGSLALSWMNDSGFWVVCKLSGFTEKETLKTWTVMLSTISIIGGTMAYLLSVIWPNPF